MTDLTPRINFAELKGYPELNENNKINTSDFLESSSEIIGVIGEYFFSYCADFQLLLIITNSYLISYIYIMKNKLISNYN